MIAAAPAPCAAAVVPTSPRMTVNWLVLALMPVTSIRSFPTKIEKGSE